jgi:hypothetical protein
VVWKRKKGLPSTNFSLGVSSHTVLWYSKGIPKDLQKQTVTKCLRCYL